MTEGSILVTGATGTVGSEVVKRLSDKGKIIMAATRSASDNTFRNLNSVRVVQLDYNNPGTFDYGLQRCRETFPTYSPSIYYGRLHLEFGERGKGSWSQIHC